MTKLVHASLETRHFTFDGYAACQDEAERLMEAAWRRHQADCERQTGVRPHDFSAFADAVKYFEVEVGSAYIDGDKLVLSKPNPRFLWAHGSIVEQYSDMQDSPAPGEDGSTVLWDRQERKAVVTVHGAYAQAMCLETIGMGSEPFTELERYFNGLSAEALLSEGMTASKEEYHL